MYLRALVVSTPGDIFSQSIVHDVYHNNTRKGYIVRSTHGTLAPVQVLLFLCCKTPCAVGGWTA